MMIRPRERGGTTAAYASGLVPRFGPGISRFLSSGYSTPLIYFRTMACFLLVWWLGSLAIGNPVLMPTPLAAAQALIDLASSGELFQSIFVSLQRLAISFGLACVIGIPLGLIIGLSVLARESLEPLVEMLRPISGIAWVPLGLYLVGVGNALPILIMFYGAVFPLILNTAAGVQSADKRLVQAARTLGVGRWHIFRQVLLPATFPNMLVGARLGVGAAWMSMVAAEMIGAPSGLGFAIEWYRELLMTPKMLAFVFTIGLLGYLLDRLLRIVQRSMTPWVRVADA